ncbi:TetR family transcriptional regulator C-terminal domain-containing protein [Dactylosporangium sp. CA-139066]|uniref:TetR family transcriptional regulator C-terminal domain-containing protein n=1 Tax=Dactylosporangium sp. CA-139066 TaxID=3239930 RepID=UPI003D8F72B7
MVGAGAPASTRRAGRRRARAFKQRIHALLHAELVRLGGPDPDETAEALLALTDGVLVAATIRPGGAPARAARSAADRLL